MWRNLRAMDLSFQWQLQPLDDASLNLNIGSAGKFSTPSLAGAIHLTDAGDAHVSIGAVPWQTSCFDFSQGGAFDAAGTWSTDITKHMFPYGQGVVANAATPDDRRVAGVVDVQLHHPKPAQVHAEFTWAAANPTAVQGSLEGDVTLDGGRVTGRLEAMGHASAGNATGMVLDRATWKLENDLPLPGITLQAGEGGFFTQLSEPQRLQLMRLRASQNKQLSA
jgi:hypothetical protein